jgi:hypothetical protein
MNVRQLEDLGAIHRPLNVVINCRPDRVERNGQMGAIVPELNPDTVFLIGHPTKSARDGIPARWSSGRVVDLGGDRRAAQELADTILAELAPDSSLVAVGNIHGQGELFLERLGSLPPDSANEPPAGARPPEPEPEPYASVASLDGPALDAHIPRTTPADRDLTHDPTRKPL